MRRATTQEPTKTQRTLADLKDLLASVPMDSLTRHWVDEHLLDLDEDMGGALSRDEARELLDEIEDLRWRLAGISSYAEY